MPSCENCGAEVETVALLHIARALEDKALCRDCLAKAVERRQETLF
jgi:hypothetical protein